MSVPALSTRWIDKARLTSDDRTRWDDLCHAASRNPFAAPWFVSPVLALEGGELLVAVDAEGEWRGVLPVAPVHRLGRVPLPHWTTVRHAHQFDGAPLIHERDAASVWRCLLTALARRHAYAAALCVSLCPKDAPAIVSLCAEQPPALVARRHERPMLRIDGSNNAKPSARRLRLDRQWTRVCDEQDATVRVLQRGEPLDAWLDALTALEAQSWKGRAGSAVGSDAAISRLFGNVLRGAHREGALRMVAIFVDSRPIAINSFFVTGNEAHGFKASFDTEFGKYAPGLQAVRLASEIAADEGLRSFDSCASGLDTPIAELWPDRRTVADLVIPLGRRRRVLLDCALAATRHWHAAKRLVA